jgi:hypothetical protein
VKLHLKQSVKEYVDKLILDYKDNIDFIELTEWEYINFLEELEDIQRILIVDPITKLRIYKNTRIKILK